MSEIDYRFAAHLSDIQRRYRADPSTFSPSTFRELQSRNLRYAVRLPNGDVPAAYPDHRPTFEGDKSGLELARERAARDPGAVVYDTATGCPVR